MIIVINILMITVSVLVVVCLGFFGLLVALDMVMDMAMVLFLVIVIVMVIVIVIATVIFIVLFKKCNWNEEREWK